MLNNNFLNASREIQGKMNELANSIDIVLDCIFRDNKIKAGKTLGNKILSLEIYLKNNDINTENKLFEKLKNFNHIWIFMKHGFVVHGAPAFTFSKDGSIEIITPERFRKLRLDFEFIQKRLLELNSEIKTEK